MSTRFYNFFRITSVICRPPYVLAISLRKPDWAGSPPKSAIWRKKNFPRAEKIFGLCHLGGSSIIISCCQGAGLSLGSSKLQQPAVFAEKFATVLRILFELEESGEEEDYDDDPEPAKWLNTLLAQWDEASPTLSTLSWEPERLSLPILFTDLMARAEKADSAARLRLTRPLPQFTELPKPKQAPENVSIANDHLWRAWVFCS